MRVRIDEPRCDDEPIGIYGFGRAAIDFADSRDAPAADGDVAAELCGTGAVDDESLLVCSSRSRSCLKNILEPPTNADERR